MNELDPGLERCERGDKDGGGEEGDIVQHGGLGSTGGARTRVEDDANVDVGLEDALRQALNGDLGDDPRGLVGGHELAKPVGEFILRQLRALPVDNI